MAVVPVWGQTWNMKIESEDPLVGRGDDGEPLQDWVDAIIDHAPVLEVATQEGRRYNGLREHVEAKAATVIGTCALQSGCRLRVEAPGIETGDVGAARLVVSCAIEGLQSKAVAVDAQARCGAHQLAARSVLEEHAEEAVADLAQASRDKRLADAAYIHAITAL